MNAEARGRLRSARTSAGLSLRELSRQTGVSPSMLSQVENGRSEPSVATLQILATHLSVSLDDLLANDIVRRPEAPGEVEAAANAVLIPPTMTPTTRAVVHMDNGVRWERLTAEGDQDFESLLVTFPAGSGGPSPTTPWGLADREYGYLTRGRLLLQLGRQEFTLEQGHSWSVDSTRPHAYRNDTDAPAIGILQKLKGV